MNRLDKFLARINTGRMYLWERKGVTSYLGALGEGV